MNKYLIIPLIIFLLIPWSFQGWRAEGIETSPVPTEVTVNSSSTQDGSQVKETPVPTVSSVPEPTPAVLNTPLPAATQAPEKAPVMLNNRVIINVVADSGLSASERAGIIQERLEAVLQRTDKPPYVVVKIIEGCPVLETKGIFILSVTNGDASANNASVSILAGLWRDALEKGLASTMKERSEGYKKEALVESLKTFIAGILVTVIVIYVYRKWFKEPGHFVAIVIWMWVISHILWIFPVSRLLSRQLIENILQPVLILFLSILILSMLFKPVDMFLKYSSELSEKLKGRELTKDIRASHRLKMRWMVLSMFVKAGMIIFAAIIVLKSFNVDFSAGLTGAGIIGVGLSLIFQDLCKDFFAGTFIVIEDQFAIGDHIRTGGFAGIVEDFNLRSTRVRDTEGRLITISNSLIRSVENSSSTWSQFDCILSVSYDTDLKKAMELMLETGRILKEEWPEKILDKPVMLGVDELSASGVKLRMFVKTAPLQQWTVKRELLLRIKSLFEKEKIEFAFPLHTVFLQKTEEK
ncbi:MAG: mechanosensitive ion channel family protein [Candidatus Eremiobacterota bacterium]